MSSLAVSLLLLVAVAIAIAIGCNLRQGAWPRWEQACRRALAGVRGSSGKPSRTEAPDAGEAPVRNGRRSALRGEPRLDAGAPNAADDHDRSPAARPLPAGDEDAAEGPAPLGGQAARAGERADEEEAFRAHGPARGGEGDAAASEDRSAVAARQPLSRPAAAPDSSVPPAPSAPSAASSPGSALPPPAGAAPAASGSAAPAGAAAAGIAGDEERRPAAVRAASTTPSAPTAPAPAAASGPTLSEACDCIIELACAARLSGERVLAIAQRFRRAGSKPVAFDARARTDDGFGLPVAGRGYDVVRVGVLMANRNGPLNAMEFSEFVSAVQAIAEALPAHIEAPAMGSVLARARDLDSTCAQLDVQIGVNVEAPEAVEPAQLAALAPALALVERGSHRYVRPGPQGEPLFSLGFSDSPSRLTFLLDVPRVAASLEPFARMMQAAQACAQRLGARLVDDGGKPLTQASLAQISRQLAQRYESLEAIGLPAGSTLACKVFN